jgi:tRNA pseudouridine38-40 synthase
MTEEVVRARLVFAYDGTDFSGWATQPGLRTVQGVMEEALGRIVRQDTPPRLTVAGRTDAGVHARAQVAHVDIGADAWGRLPGRSSDEPPAALLRRLRSVVPPDISLLAADIAPIDFDARFSALQRRYAYRIADASSPRDPLLRRHVTWNDGEIDVPAMAAASASLTGLRDFAPFCKAREGATTIRDLLEFSWERPASGADAGLLVATVRADAFCHSMVRSLVGAVLAVGQGRRDQAWLDRIAAGTARSQEISVAPAHGLTLEGVVYPPDAELAVRAIQTRARRGEESAGRHDPPPMGSVNGARRHRGAESEL